MEFKVYDYNGIIPAAASGDVDCIMANLNVTPERARALTFSDDIFEQQVGIMVRDEGATNGATNFAGKVKDSFVSTFLLENRWVLFVRGILVTVFITVMGILLGSGLGFLIYMLCRGGNLFLNRLNDVFSRIILGMPMVVLLMVLYYIIFGNVSISPVAVSVIGFTMSFACSVFGLLRLGESSIDKGQYDAAYALGHSKNNTFFRIILPQVLPMIMDSYKGEITGLIKATAIVGYIAVQDLTKVGDIVRSRTYDAFFPLIAIAAIYFIMEWIFMIIVKKLQAWLDPKKERGRKLLKGVVLHDKD